LPSLFVVLRGLKVAECGYFRFYYTEAYFPVFLTRKRTLIFIVHLSWTRIGLFANVGESQVRLDLLDISKLLPRIRGAHARWHDNVISDVPVDRRDNTLLVTSLQAVDNPQDFCGVTTGARRVVHLQPDLLGGVNDEHRADGERNALLLDVVEVVLSNHVVEEGNLAVSVGDDGELDSGVLCLVDIVDPLVVGAEVVGALENSQYLICTSEARLTYKTQHLYATGIKLILQLCECSELRCADRCEVGRMREQDSPFAVEEIVELDLSMSCLRLEIRSD
jgi:hypothetical protein